MTGTARPSGEPGGNNFIAGGSNTLALEAPMHMRQPARRLYVSLGRCAYLIPHLAQCQARLLAVRQQSAFAVVTCTSHRAPHTRAAQRSIRSSGPSF